MSDMRVGLFVNTEESATRADRDVWVAELSGQVELARSLGFAGISFGHHHSIGPTQWAHPLVTAARLSAVADGMDVVLGVYLLGQYQPLEVAEQLATLDACSRGRLRAGAAPGWARTEFETLGIDHGKRFARFYECVDVVRQLWRGEAVTHRGDFFELRDVTLTHLPVQPGGPPIWLGASVPTAARRAARTGDSFLMSSHPTVSELQAAGDAFAEERAALGLPPPEDRPILRNAYIAPSYEKALEIALPHLAESYSAFAGWRMFDDVLDDRTSRDTLLSHREDRERLEAFARDRFILGDPSQVRDQLAALERRLGVNYVFLRMQWPGMPDAVARQAIGLFADEVLPELS